MEGLGSSQEHGLMLLKAILEFGHPLVQRFGWSLLYAESSAVFKGLEHKLKNLCLLNKFK